MRVILYFFLDHYVTNLFNLLIENKKTKIFTNKRSIQISTTKRKYIIIHVLGDPGRPKSQSMKTYMNHHLLTNNTECNVVFTGKNSFPNLTFSPKSHYPNYDKLHLFSSTKRFFYGHLLP